MAPNLPKRRFSPVRWLTRAILFALVFFVVYMSYRDQFSELFAPLAPAKGISTSSKGPDASNTRLPTVVTLGPGGQATSTSGPKVVDLRGAPSAPPPPAPALQAGRIEVVDGDTVRIDSQSYRLVGLDAPESGARAKCVAERELSERTTRRLREIVAGGAQIQRVPCGCPTGTEGTDKCNYGRFCGVLTVGGRDVALMLIGEGLARRYDCYNGHCPPKQGWCS